MKKLLARPAKHTQVPEDNFDGSYWSEGTQGKRLSHPVTTGVPSTPQSLSSPKKRRKQHRQHHTQEAAVISTLGNVDLGHLLFPNGVPGGQ